MAANDPTNDQVKEIQRLKDLLQEKEDRLQEAQDTLEAIQSGAVDGIVRTTPEGEQVFILKGSDQPYRNLIEEISEGALLISNSGTILYCNIGFARLVGTVIDRVLGTQINNWVSARNVEEVEALVSGNDSRKIFELSLQPTKGQLVPAQVSVSKIQIGSISALALILTDLSKHMEKEIKSYTRELEKEVIKRKKTEEALFEAKRIAEQNSRNLYTVLETIPLAVAILEKTTKEFVYANNRSKELFGLDLVKSNLGEFAAKFKPKRPNGLPYPVEELPLNRALNGRRVLDEEIIVECEGGKAILLSRSAVPLVNAAGVTFAAVSVDADITERKKAEDALRQAQTNLQVYANNLEQLVEERTKKLQDSERLATIGATAGMVGHDIRNPLQAITGNLFLAISELDLLPPSAEKINALDELKEIEKNVDYINKIVADLQDYSKILRPVAKETNLANLCQEVLLTNEIPKNVQASCLVADDSKTIITDPDLLKRVLVNLTSNALHAMPNGGKLNVQILKENGDTVIEVQDTGVGIPDDIKPKLFTPLFTTRPKGQGFGLPVVKRMTEALGGKVTFESEVGKGTKFILRFPPPTTLSGKWVYKKGQ